MERTMRKGRQRPRPRPRGRAREWVEDEEDLFVGADAGIMVTVAAGEVVDDADGVVREADAELIPAAVGGVDLESGKSLKSSLMGVLPFIWGCCLHASWRA